jgi:hypothetical protein
MTAEEAMRLLVWNDQTVYEPIDDEATAANILAAIRAAVLEERGRCAKIADEGEEREGRSGQGESGWVARRIREGTP